MTFQLSPFENGTNDRSAPRIRSELPSASTSGATSPSPLPANVHVEPSAPVTASSPQLNSMSTSAGPSNAPVCSSYAVEPSSSPHTPPGKPAIPIASTAPSIRPKVPATSTLPRTSNGVRVSTRPTPMPIRTSGQRFHQPAIWEADEPAGAHRQRDQPGHDEEDAPRKQTAVDLHRPAIPVRSVPPERTRSAVPGTGRTSRPCNGPGTGSHRGGHGLAPAWWTEAEVFPR